MLEENITLDVRAHLGNERYRVGVFTHKGDPIIGEPLEALARGINDKIPGFSFNPPGFASEGPAVVTEDGELIIGFIPIIS